MVAVRYFKLTVYTVLYLFTAGLIASSFLLKHYTYDNAFIHILRGLVIFFADALLTKYTIYMFIAPWFSVIAAREDGLVNYFVRDYCPLVSVMIPAWNEEVGLPITLRSLLASTYRRMEIIIVNDGSTDNSDSVMQRFIARYEQEMASIPAERRIKIKYQYQQNGGKGSALNTAISMAQGDILLSIDADCLVDAGAVEAFVKVFRNPNIKAAVGNVKIGNTKTLVGATQALEYTSGFYFKLADSLLNTIYIIGGAAGAFRREVFDVLGGYDTHNITEDIELSVRIQKQGWRIAYCPDAIITTEGASTVYGLMKQRLRWKRGRFQTFWQHRSLFFSIRPEHNKILTWAILPVAIFGDIQLGFEPVFILVLYFFSVMTQDFSAFLSGVIIVALMLLLQMLHSHTHKRALLLAPVGWCLFYLCTFVEVYALAKSLWLLIRGKELKWQKWQRQGAVDVVKK